MTNLYSVYHAWKGDRHVDFLRLHERYGNVVRFGPNSLSFNTSDALTDIYHNDKNVRKTSFYSFFNVNKTAENTHSTADKQVHARKRRVLSLALSSNAVKSMEEKIVAHTRLFCEALTKQSRSHENETCEVCSVSKLMDSWSPAMDMAEWTLYFALDITSDLCFGNSPRTISSSDNRYVTQLINNSSRKTLLCGLMPQIKSLGIDKYLFPPPAGADRKSFVEHNRQSLEARIATGMQAREGTKHTDILSILLAAKDRENGSTFSKPELWAETNLLVIAGVGTTTVAFAATLFYLLHNPPALSRLATELQSTFPSISAIRLGPGALDSCAYLRACIDETMRLSPPLPGFLPREVYIDGGMVIAGHAVPAGTEVGVPTYAIHHNPLYYRDPFSYRPERWIVDVEADKAGEIGRDEADFKRARLAFCPFSLGSQSCTGKNVAYAELAIVLARTVYLFDMRLEPGSEGRLGAGGSEGDKAWGGHRGKEFQLWDSYVATVKGPRVQFKQRRDL